MAENHTCDWRLPKWLRSALLVVTVIATTSEAGEGVCKRLTVSTNAAALSTLATTEPSPHHPVHESFALWNSGKPATLAATIIASSKELQQLERALVSDTRAVQSPSVFFLHAPAGSGKTPLMRYLRKRSRAAYVDLRQVKTDLDTGAGKWATREPELSLLGKDLSWQPKLTAKALEGGLEPFVDRVTGSKQDYSRGILVDSIDEVHPDSAAAILKSIEQYSDSHPGRMVVVAGRGEAFWDYLVHNQFPQVQSIRIPTFYVGNHALLEWYIGNYVAFKTRADIPDTAKSAELLSGLRGLLQRHHLTRNFLYPGVLANFAIENVRYSDQDSHRLEALMFQSLVDRNRKTHNRPARGNGQAWKIYENALIQIARHYRPDPNTGIFLIGSEDAVCVTDGQSFGDANVGRVLMQSGLVDVNLANARHLEFSFWPRNLHRFIAAGKLE